MKDTVAPFVGKADERLDQQLLDLAKQLCTSSPSETPAHNETDHWSDDNSEEDLAQVKVARAIFDSQKTTEANDIDAIMEKQLKHHFEVCDQDINLSSSRQEYDTIEVFIKNEQNLARQRRSNARKVEAAEEIRLAAGVAEIKEFRDKVSLREEDDKLQRRVSEAEYSYMKSRMTFAKASQVAASECRLEFSRAREFFEQLYLQRLQNLKQQHQRSLRLQKVLHVLRGTNERIISLDKRVANRLYEKKVRDIKELHQAQNLEEAAYLDTMLDMMDMIQSEKGLAAREVFELQVQHFQQQCLVDTKRKCDLNELVADAKKEMANMLALSTLEVAHQEEDDNLRDEKVEQTERKKIFEASPKEQIMSVSRLYDLVLWSVATNQVGTTVSSTKVSDVYSEFEDQNETEPASLYSPSPDGMAHAGADSTSTRSDNDSNNDQFSPIGHMRIKMISKELRKKRLKLAAEHEAQSKKERLQFRREIRGLKQKQQLSVGKLLNEVMLKRQSLRNGISKRLEDLAEQQELSSERLQKSIEGEWRQMQSTLRSEQRRIQEAETKSYAKAQGLVSAQVFHEVRNALSSVIAMSEITTSLRDEQIPSEKLAASVDNMMGEIREVVSYSLGVLNNILDVNKIQSGASTINIKHFDAQELVKRATKMQMSKTGRRVKMAFVPTSDCPCLVESDPDILAQIIANMISNAVKFTTSGAVQPFVWPAEALVPINDNDQDSVTDDVFSKATFLRSSFSPGRDLGGIEVMNTHVDAGTSNPIKASPQLGSNSNSESTARCDQSLGVSRRLAIGVVDTGPGLSARKLKDAYNDLVSASNEVSTIDGLKNTGFGLHLSHILARAIGTRLHLSSLAQIQNLCNNDVKSSVAEGRSGTGTVLYIEVPVSDLRSASIRSPSLLPGLSKEAANAMESNLKDPHPNFKFCPKPIEDTFRILVADDIFMLRKGIVHALAKVFTSTNCPVSIVTACSAEESLRLVESETFDLVILDNDFSQAAGTPLDKGQVRSRLVLDTDAVATDTLKPMSEKISSFFKNERFSIQEGDGVLVGYDAMKQLAEKPGGPLLMLLSGRTLSFPSHLGVMLAQKPLKQSELVPYLEYKADDLVQSGRCHLEHQKTEEDGCKISSENINTVVIVNRQGSQVFSSNPG